MATVLAFQQPHLLLWEARVPLWWLLFIAGAAPEASA